MKKNAIINNVQILVGHIVNARNAGKTVDEIVADDRTQSFLRQLVKSEFEHVGKDDKE